jgi:hypothetical protein
MEICSFLDRAAYMLSIASASCAGVPKDAIISMHLSPELTSHAIQHPIVDFVFHWKPDL